MGGLNAADRLKASGIDAAKGTAIYADPGDVHRYPEGHQLFDPRSLWPVDMGLVESIRAGTIKPLVVVRDDGIPKGAKKRRLGVIDGGRRALATEWINDHLNSGEVPRKVELAIVSGDDNEMRLYRFRLNGQRKNETPGTLAYKILDAERAGIEVEAICGAYGCTSRFIEQVKRFPQCIKSVKDAFDTGKLPIEVLGTFVDVPPDEQAEFLHRVLAKLPPDAKAEPGAARQAIRKTKRQEGRVKTVKQAKSLPSALLFRLAGKAPAALASAKEADLVVATLLYAGGKPDRLKTGRPDLFELLEEERKKKAPGK